MSTWETAGSKEKTVKKPVRVAKTVEQPVGGQQLEQSVSKLRMESQLELLASLSRLKGDALTYANTNLSLNLFSGSCKNIFIAMHQAQESDSGTGNGWVPLENYKILALDKEDSDFLRAKSTYIDNIDVYRNRASVIQSIARLKAQHAQAELAKARHSINVGLDKVIKRSNASIEAVEEASLIAGNMLLDVTTSVQTKAKPFRVGGKDAASITATMAPFSKENLKVILTGIDAFDSNYRGLAYGMLSCIAGPTGGCKSTLAACIGYHAAYKQHLRVAYISLEMNENVIISRQVSYALHIPFDDICRKNTTVDQEKAWQRLTRNMRENGGAFDVLTRRTLANNGPVTASSIVNYLKSSTYDLVIIDDISMMYHSDTHKTFQQQLKEDLDKLNIFVSERGNENPIHIMMLSQLNEDGDTRGSKDVEMYASYFLRWSIVNIAVSNSGDVQLYSTTKNKSQSLPDGQIFAGHDKLPSGKLATVWHIPLHVKKTREGQPGVITVECNTAYMHFGNTTRPTPPPEQLMSITAKSNPTTRKMPRIGDDEL